VRQHLDEERPRAQRLDAVVHRDHEEAQHCEKLRRAQPEHARDEALVAARAAGRSARLPSDAESGARCRMLVDEMLSYADMERRVLVVPRRSWRRS